MYLVLKKIGMNLLLTASIIVLIIIICLYVRNKYVFRVSDKIYRIINRVVPGVVLAVRIEGPGARVRNVVLFINHQKGSLLTSQKMAEMKNIVYQETGILAFFQIDDIDNIDDLDPEFLR